MTRRYRSAIVATASAFCLWFVGGGVAHALILSTYYGEETPSSVNTTAPADDPGWANSAGSATGGRSAIYLGDQWVLTANHVSTGEIVLPSGTYTPIPGTDVVLTNPDFFDANGNGVSNGSGTSDEDLSSRSDLKLFRIDTHPETGLTPEEMDPDVAPVVIASEGAVIGTGVTGIAAGTRRVLHPSKANGRWRFDADFELTDDDDSPNEGYLTSSASQPDVVREKAWGTNRLDVTSGVQGMVDNGTQGIVRVESTNDVIGVVTKFDRGVDSDGNLLNDGWTFDEFQGFGGDSGGPVFEKDSAGQWVLRGVFHAIYTIPDQPTNVINPMYDMYTGISDLSVPHYYDQIAELRDSDLYSVIGDVDLDGVVTGEIVDGVATGDLAALVDGWLYQQSEADIHSWKRGDLNQDGLTDLADFVLLRDALDGTIAVSELSQLVGGLVVPEPGAAGLALLGVALSGGRRSRVR